MALIRFIETKQYDWFTEFCDECREHRYIGICHGPAGVGKTLSARRYTQWDAVEALPRHLRYDYIAPEGVRHSRAIYFCPDVLNSARSVVRDVSRLRHRLSHISVKSRENADRLVSKFGAPEGDNVPKLAVERPAWWRHENPPNTVRMDVFEEIVSLSEIDDPTELIVVDEADRLKMPALEQLRSIYDQGGIGMVLIGMPGIEKQLSRFPQLYSRVGFVHAFTPLSPEELAAILLEKLHLPDYGLPQGALQDKEALAAIIRAARGNFRLMQRLLLQLRRIMDLNQLSRASREAVEAAIEGLVLGSSD